jgi:hypothetical protein
MGRRRAAEHRQRLLRDPGRRAAGLHRQAERDQAGQQEHRLPAHRLVGLLDLQHAGQDHADGAGHQGDRQADVGKQDQASVMPKECQRRPDLVRAQLLVRIFGGDDDEVAVLFQARQRFPSGMHHQRVARLQRHVADAVALAQRLAAAMQRGQRNAVGLAHPDVARALADQLRAGRDHHLGDARLGRRQLLGEGFQFITQLQSVGRGELAQALRRAEHAEHAAGGDLDVARRTHAQVVAAAHQRDHAQAVRVPRCR